MMADYVKGREVEERFIWAGLTFPELSYLEDEEGRVG